MLEKIGLPAKPSLRGNNWVVDASNCQGCNSQFTFINRKHHCRRCGGLFCGSCTQQRMFLRGQGDSPVRICEPCKNLEEAARFELRHGNKSRAGRGSSRLTVKNEDEVLNEIVGSAREEYSNNDMVSSIQRATSSTSCSNTQEAATQDGEPNHLKSEMGSASPEELRQRALDEKKKYKILKGEGKSEEALRSFKKGKELERQAEALEIYLRKSRKKVLSSGNMAEIQNKDVPSESGRKNKILPRVGKEKDNLAAELIELGWSDKDLRDEDKKSASISLEGELSSLLGEVSQKTDKYKVTRSIDMTEVVALKKKALMLKREGKLAEAKEELKRAKVLEKQLEEQELLAGAEDSDDELSALIRSMDNDKEEELSIQYEQEQGFDFNHLVGAADGFFVESNFEVTDDDMEDPEIAAALKSLGWAEDSIHHKNILTQSVPVDREAMFSEIHSLKIEALNKKRAGNVAEAMEQLKKAKVLERDLENLESQEDNLTVQNPIIIQKGLSSLISDKSSKSVNVDDGNVNARKDLDPKLAPKSRLTIQKELLSLKKKALALRREGRLDEAEEELRKGKVLEHQLEEMDNASKVKATTQVVVGSKDPDVAYTHPDFSRNLPVGEVREGEEDVTDADMHDPTYISLLKNLGWNDEDNELANSPSKPFKQDDNLSVQITESSSTQAPSNILVGGSRRSKAELQRELLSLKRKALSLRRQGMTEESEEVLRMAKSLETQLEEMEAPKKEVQVESNKPKEKIFKPPVGSAVKEGDEGDVIMHDPAQVLMLKDLEWKDKKLDPLARQERPTQVTGSTLHTTDISVIESSSDISVAARRSKAEIQRELLGLKRKALALRRKGETDEAEELLRMAKVLEAQMEDLEAPKKEFLINASSDKKPERFELLIAKENHENLNHAVEVNKGSSPAVVGLNNKLGESSTGFGRMESDTANPSLRNFDFLMPVTSKLTERNHPFFLELGTSGEVRPPDNITTAEGTACRPPPGQSVNLMDLLTGDDWSSQMLDGKQKEKLNFGSDLSSLSGPPISLGSQMNPKQDLGSKDDVTTEKREMVHADEKSNVHIENSVQKNDSSPRQEILAHKRKAVALKREGKLTEAREELRQAKLLERSLEEDTPQPKTGPSAVSTSIAPFVGKKEHGSSNLAQKPLSGRDRFKLQQQSLSHKRQALKLRREGRIEEAEAEFELAKALETQLEELTAHDPTQSSVSKPEPVDDAIVDDLLDPQLLSALKAIGVHDANMVSQESSSKLNVGKSENSNQERTQLEDRIKEEKVKAVNLKRSGKQAEALDALRRAKVLEKKLNSFASQ